MDRLNIPPDVPVESKVVTRAIRSAQTQIEQQNFEIRKDVLKYDDVLNRQRKVIYGERHSVLEGADLQDQVLKMIDEVIDSYVAGATAEGFPEDWDLNKLWRAFKQLFPITVTVEELEDDARRQGQPDLGHDRRCGGGGRSRRLRAPRGGAHPRDHARVRAPGGAVGPGPQVA